MEPGEGEGLEALFNEGATHPTSPATLGKGRILHTAAPILFGTHPIAKQKTSGKEG